MTKSLPQVTVRETRPGSFAVIGPDGAILRDNFPTQQVAWMWCAKRGLHEGRNKRKRKAREIPNDLIDDQILGLPLLAQLSNISYGEFLSRAKVGAFGVLIRTGQRTFGIRRGDWKRAMAAQVVNGREVKTTAT